MHSALFRSESSGGIDPLTAIGLSFENERLVRHHLADSEPIELSNILEMNPQHLALRNEATIFQCKGEEITSIVKLYNGIGLNWWDRGKVLSRAYPLRSKQIAMNIILSLWNWEGFGGTNTKARDNILREFTARTIASSVIPEDPLFPLPRLVTLDQSPVGILLQTQQPITDVVTKRSLLSNFDEEEYQRFVEYSNTLSKANIAPYDFTGIKLYMRGPDGSFQGFANLVNTKKSS